MPYLRLSSLPLDEETKRRLADELTSTVLDILPAEKPEWTSVHFTAFEPSDFAIAGRLVADGAIPDTHLEISAPGVDEKQWFALRNRLTDVLIDALAIPDSERWHVNVKLNRYERHSFAVAGNAADEIDASGHLAQDRAPSLLPENLFEPNRGGRRRRFPRTRLFLGFVAGAVVAYRWLTKRLGNDATVDAAAPLGAGETSPSPSPDDRQTADDAAPTTVNPQITDAAAIREY